MGKIRATEKVEKYRLMWLDAEAKERPDAEEVHVLYWPKEDVMVEWVDGKTAKESLLDWAMQYAIDNMIPKNAVEWRQMLSTILDLATLAISDRLAMYERTRNLFAHEELEVRSRRAFQALEEEDFQVWEYKELISWAMEWGSIRMKDLYQRADKKQRVELRAFWDRARYASCGESKKDEYIVIDWRSLETEGG